MLSEKVPLLESKITNLEQINSNWSQVDSLRSTQIASYQNNLAERDKQINNLHKTLNKTKYITGGSILATVILTVICVLK